jgi:hypothetical protein
VLGGETFLITSKKERSRKVNIVVLLKQVPDTETKIRIGGDGKTIDTSDIKWIMNPYDEYAGRVYPYCFGHGSRPRGTGQ